MLHWSHRLALGITALVVTASLSLADDLAKPAGPVILMVSGPLAKTNAVSGAEFDLAMLEAMDIKTVETGTIWTEGTQRFEGVSLRGLLNALGAQGTTVRLTALNDYAVDLPLSDVRADGPILAFRMDGAVLSSRDKGPIWVVYPFDSKPEYQNEVSYSRSVWQLVSIEVLP